MNENENSRDLDEILRNLGKSTTSEFYRESTIPSNPTYNSETEFPISFRTSEQAAGRLMPNLTEHKPFNQKPHFEEAEKISPNLPKHPNKINNDPLKMIFAEGMRYDNKKIQEETQILNTNNIIKKKESNGNNKIYSDLSSVNDYYQKPKDETLIIGLQKEKINIKNENNFMIPVFNENNIKKDKNNLILEKEKNELQIKFDKEIQIKDNKFIQMKNEYDENINKLVKENFSLRQNLENIIFSKNKEMEDLKQIFENKIKIFLESEKHENNIKFNNEKIIWEKDLKKLREILDTKIKECDYLKLKISDYEIKLEENKIYIQKNENEKKKKSFTIANDLIYEKNEIMNTNELFKENLQLKKNISDLNKEIENWKQRNSNLEMKINEMNGVLTLVQDYESKISGLMKDNERLNGFLKGKNDYSQNQNFYLEIEKLKEINKSQSEEIKFLKLRILDQQKRIFN